LEYPTNVVVAPAFDVTWKASMECDVKKELGFEHEPVVRDEQIVRPSRSVTV
jgi:hypothetical protein